MSSVDTPAQPIPRKSQQIKTDKPRPHICSVCTRAFARLEHLKRHERSHTNEKPFQCAACGRCFARRDLVLRHQQKLHPSLPNIMRRGLAPAKDDASEYIIVLQNNTSANAPLPDHVDKMYAHIKDDSALSSPADPSPGSASDIQFRSVFGHQPPAPPHRRSTGTDSFIPSPIPTTSSLNTPPHSTAKLIKLTQQPLPQTGDSPDSKRPNPIPQHVRSSANITPKTRHASFSAASALSYTNNKDAFDIQQNTLFEAPEHVEFTTPQLQASDRDRAPISGLDLSAMGIDWSNIDSLDLSTSNLKHATLSSASLTQLQNSSAAERRQYFDSSVMAAHQFQNPNHPHHIKGTTPFEFGMPPPNDTNLMHQVFHMDDNFQLNYNGMMEQRKKRELESVDPTSKKQRTKLSSSSDDTGWLQEIINTPYEANFPVASHHIGFTGSPVDSSPSNINEITSLFRSRQIDLVKQMNPILPNGNDISLAELGDDKTLGQSIPSQEHDINVEFSIGEFHADFITDELRNKIILVSNISNLQFPPLDDLNAYMRLYEKEFNKYFPFIHLPSLKNPMVDNFENIPLLLSMTAIGALYSYHDSNTLLLFNLSKYHIQHFFEKEVTLNNLQFKKVPLMAHQCLVLHIFISMFLNEPNMLEISSRQMRSMVGLIRSTNFHKPLEHFLIPPAQINDSSNTTLIQNNFDYFIMAQSRIRTIYCFYMLEVFRSSLIGLPVPLLASAIECGSHCANENLWRCEDAGKWYKELLRSEPRNIVDLSNHESVSNMIVELNNHYHLDNKLSHNNLLTLLMNIHEQIQCEYLKYQDTQDNITLILNWRLHSRPKLEKIIKSWESFFIRNGGFIVVNEHNNHILNSNSEFKLILPLLWFARIRLCINITPIMKKVLYKDWDGMNRELSQLDDDFEGLKESTTHAMEIVNLWIHNISIINDAKQTSLRTPVFFVTCVFVSILIISKYLDLIENSEELTVFDKVYWLNCNEMLEKIEPILCPTNETNSYLEVLRQQSNGVFDSVGSDAFKKNGDYVKGLVEEKNADSKAVISAMRAFKLSTKSLFLGVRILADAPVWPLAMGFAEALKNRATRNQL